MDVARGLRYVSSHEPCEGRRRGILELRATWQTTLKWAAWPCEDLWNLLPAHPDINRNSKRDRIPSAWMLERSMDRILDWWHAGYVGRDGATAERFRTEAHVFLPVERGATRLEDLFTGVQFRRQALRADQLIEEWML